ISHIDEPLAGRSVELVGGETGNTIGTDTQHTAIRQRQQFGQRKRSFSAHAREGTALIPAQPATTGSIRQQQRAVVEQGAGSQALAGGYRQLTPMLSC